MQNKSIGSVGLWGASERLPTGRTPLSVEVIVSSGRFTRKVQDEGVIGVWLRRRYGHYRQGHIHIPGTS